MEDMGMKKGFWQGKRVLLTGHTGFKGAWLSLWLHRLGADVTGVSLPPASAPNLFTLAQIGNLTNTHICDIRTPAELQGVVVQSAPEITIHMAAQSLVRTGFRDPVDTFATNTLGTANLLDALRISETVRVVVVVTTDKVYKNIEQPYPYREDDALGGYDPYSASKAAAEMVVACYRDSFLAKQGVAVASARAGNVIGGGDWSEDRLIPDAIRAWSSDETLTVRRPQAVRPWQHVLEPLYGYLQLAEQLWYHPELAGPYNFGPHTHEAASVRDVIEQARTCYGRGNVIWEDGTQGPHEAGWLALEIARSRRVLGVLPRWHLADSVARTMDWYRQWHAGDDARTLCAMDINRYEAEQ